MHISHRNVAFCMLLWQGHVKFEPPSNWCNDPTCSACEGMTSCLCRRHNSLRNHLGLWPLCYTALLPALHSDLVPPPPPPPLLLLLLLMLMLLLGNVSNWRHDCYVNV